MPVTVEDMPLRKVIDSLYSTTCPACGDRKGKQKSLCFSCFTALPSRVRGSLYNRVGQGYELALFEAMTALGAEKFHEERPQ